MSGWSGRGLRRDIRPSDTERDRYTAVLDAARSEGRIDDAEYSRRAFAVRYGTSVGELEDITADLPGPDPRNPGRRLPVVLATTGVLAVLGAGVVAGLVSTRPESGEPPGNEPIAESGPLEQVQPADEPEPEPEIDMFSAAELTRLRDSLAAAEVAGLRSVRIFPDSADIDVQAASNTPYVDSAEYHGELSEFEPRGQVSGDPAEEFFDLPAIDPGVIAAIAAQAAEVAGFAGRQVDNIIVERSSRYRGVVTIRATLVGDAYRGSPSLTWDNTGRHLLDDGRTS